MGSLLTVMAATRDQSYDRGIPDRAIARGTTSTIDTPLMPSSGGFTT